MTFLLVFSFSVTLLGNETAQKYFPHTLGSYWVYEDQDGNEVTRRATKGEEIAGKTDHAFSYEPKLEDWADYSPFIYPSLYYVSETGITLLVGDKIERAVKARLKEDTDIFAKVSKAMETPDFEIENKVVVERDHLLLLPDTITTDEAWDTTEIVAKIKILYDDIIGEVTYNFMIDQKGVVLGTENVNTPAGTFKDCLKVKYHTTTVHVGVGGRSAISNTEAPGETVTTVWFAPNIGIVKTHQERQHIFLEIIPDTEDFTIDIPTLQSKTLELKKIKIKKTDNKEQ